MRARQTRRHWVSISIVCFLLRMNLAPPSLGSVSPSFVVFREGHSAELRCDAAGGIPLPTSTWLKDSHEVDQSSRLHVVQTSTTTTTAAAAGFVIPGGGGGGPTSGPVHQVSSSSNSPDIARHGLPVSAPLTLPGTRLVIKHVVAADAGIYTCLFKNNIAQVSHTVRVIVRGEYIIIIIIMCKAEIR